MTKILIDEATVKLVLEALENINSADNDRDFLGPEECCDLDNAITALREALASEAIEQPAQQEPVAFLANGTRFKISYDSRQSGGQIHGIPIELGGRWVAFVAADDDCHLKLTSPPAQRKPLDAGEISRLWKQHTNEDGPHHNPYDDDGLGFARAMEAAHNIKENT